jgi:integrase
VVNSADLRLNIQTCLNPHRSKVEFRGHDLRRTAASLMVGAGVPRLVVSKILNHVETGVTAVYDRHSYDLEKRAALDFWRKRLESILANKTSSARVLRFSGGHG